MYQLLTQCICLLVIILLLVMVAQKLKIAYPILLVIGGLVLSFVPGIPTVAINPEVIFVVFLPPLLYEAAWYTSWKEFWKWRRIIGSFAFIIIIVTSFIVAIVSSNLIPGFTLALGFLLGGIVSPPDAVSATTVLKYVKVPRRIVTILEGESLLNDAASLIVFRFALVAVTTGTFSLHEATVDFAVVIVMGIATGIAIAMIFFSIHRWLPTNGNIDILLTLITPYAMYIVAERFHFSGVLAVVSGGLFLSARSHLILDYRSRVQGAQVWSTLVFALNGFIFMMIGLELPVIVSDLGSVGLSAAIKYSLIISFVLIIARILCTLGASAFTMFISRFIKTADSNPGWKGPLVFGWAGMRGVVSLAAALSVPLYLSVGVAFPFRNLILFITFTVILVTLVLQGLTLPFLARMMKLEETDYPLPLNEQELQLRKTMTDVVLRLLDEKYLEDVKKNPWLKSLERKLRSDGEMIGSLQRENGFDGVVGSSFNAFRNIFLELIVAQRGELLQLNKKADTDERAIRKYQSQLDIEEEQLRHQFNHEE